MEFPSLFQNVLCLDFSISSSFLLFTYKKPVSEVREQVGCGRELGSLDQSLESGNKVLFEKNRRCVKKLCCQIGILR